MIKKNGEDPPVAHNTVKYFKGVILFVHQFTH